MICDRCPVWVRADSYDPIVPRPLRPERQTCARTSQLAREVPEADTFPYMNLAVSGQDVICDPKTLEAAMA
jgi:hypothetical protein